MEHLNDLMIVRYQAQRQLIRHYAETKHLTKDECIGQLKQNYKWFKTLSGLGYGYTYTKDTKLTNDLKQMYYSDELGEVIYILYYRDYVVPVYHDDAGQQEIAKIPSATMYGGAYNFDAIYDFMSEIDRDEYYDDVKYIAKCFKMEE